MHPQDLIGPDLLSEILLLSCGAVLFLTLILILVAALS